jgi:hypothetical protein
MFWRRAENLDHRHVHFGSARRAENAGFCSNKITTSL